MLKYYLYIIGIIFTLQSCTESEDETNFTEETISSTTSETKVTLTITTSDGELKEGYIIMMFDKVFNPEDNLKTPFAKVTSNSDGIAIFNLGELITSSTKKTYYFEAFMESSTGLTLKSKFRKSLDLNRGTSSTTSIIVD